MRLRHSGRKQKNRHDAGCITDANSATLYVKTSSGSSVHLRSTPQDHCDNVITSVPYGREVDVLGYEGQWTYVLHNGQMGYMMSRYLVADKPGSYTCQSTGGTGSMGGSASGDVQLPSFDRFEHVSPYNVVVSPAKPNGYVNFRWAPSTSCRVMQRCYANTPLAVIAESSNWAQVRDDETGYVGFFDISVVVPGHYELDEEWYRKRP